MLRATCPGGIYGYTSQRGTSYWRLRYIEDKCSRICLIDLTSFTSRYCFVRTLHREYAWWSRGEEVSPTSTSYCADILFNGYSFWWQLFCFAASKHEVWIRRRWCEISKSITMAYIISSFVLPCTNLRCDTSQSVCDLRGRLADDEEVSVAGYLFQGNLFLVEAGPLD